jgi:hypothetical protein
MRQRRLSAPAAVPGTCNSKSLTGATTGVTHTTHATLTANAIAALVVTSRCQVPGNELAQNLVFEALHNDRLPIAHGVV